jgi:hypothetical protein
MGGNSSIPSLIAVNSDRRARDKSMVDQIAIALGYSLCCKHVFDVTQPQAAQYDGNGGT